LGGVRPCVAQGSETGLALGDGGERVQEVAGGSCETVKSRYHQHVARLKRLDHPSQLRRVGFRAAHMHVAENLLAASLGQLAGLRVNALALAARRYPCVAVFHAALCTYISHKKGA